MQLTRDLFAIAKFLFSIRPTFCSPTDELIRDQRSVVSTAQSIQAYRVG